jgi:hypothetical protein
MSSFYSELHYATYLKIPMVVGVFCPCQLALVGPDHHSAKKVPVLILTMKLWKMKKSSYLDHEIMNLVEKDVGTPAILLEMSPHISFLYNKY